MDPRTQEAKATNTKRASIPPPRHPQRTAVWGTQVVYEHNASVPKEQAPYSQTHSLESQVPYLEGPFPLGELLLILQDPAQVFPLLRSFP